MTEESPSINILLAAEMNARKKLNKLQKERERITLECRDTLNELNHLKRLLYQMGFKGNIMRDADGNRIMSFDSK